MSHPVHMVHLMTVDVVTELWEGGFGQGWDQEEWERENGMRQRQMIVGMECEEP